MQDSSVSSITAYRVKTRQATKGIQRPSNKDKRKYSHIPEDVKQQLLFQVLEKGYRIKDAAINLNLNYSTAKTIMYTQRHQKKLRAQYRQITLNDKPFLKIQVRLESQVIRENMIAI
ncbi:hypothetical protein pb186bvf_008833 [Paramecium bursaria]